MSTIKVDGIRSNSATSDAITLASDGTCTANITNRSNRNLIINGAMQVAQRGTSSTSNGYQTVDRWAAYSGDHDATVTSSQQSTSSSDTPYQNGFSNFFRFALNGAGTANANAYFELVQKIEAQDIATSGWNFKSSSSSITLSFWVRASTNQTFYGFLKSYDGTSYIYAFSFTASGNNTWTKITKTITGNSNLQFDNNNAQGLQILLTPFYGTDYTNDRTLNTWTTVSTSNYFPDMASTWLTAGASTFDITGVQLEVGSVASDFEHRSFHDELLKCYRYFNKKNPGYGRIGHMYSGSNLAFTMDLPCEMRASPTITNEGGLYFARQNGVSIGLTGIAHGSADTTTARVSLAANSNVTTGEDAFIWSGNTFYLLDSEL